MDALDHLAGPATDLLHRADSVLIRAGAPADHAVWPLLRRLRVLPGDAVHAVATLRPGPLAATGPALGPLSRAYAEAGGVAGRAVAWSGPAADAFAGRAAALAAHLADPDASGAVPRPAAAMGLDAPARPGRGGRPHPGLAARVADTAGYAEAVAAWMASARSRLAHSLGVVLGCAQAVTLRTAVITTPAAEPPDATPPLDAAAGPGAGPAAGPPPPDVVAAAADIAARVLATVADAYEDGQALLDSWQERLAEAPWQRPAVAGPPPGGTTSVGG